MGKPVDPGGLKPSAGDSMRVRFSLLAPIIGAIGRRNSLKKSNVQVRLLHDGPYLISSVDRALVFETRSLWFNSTMGYKLVAGLSTVV